jgi:hypothetical protein
MSGHGGAVRYAGLLAVACGLVLTVSTVIVAGNQVGAGVRRSASHTVWLCNPKTANACTMNRTATSVSASGVTAPVIQTTAASASKFDCFYVYPTVSFEPGANADLTIQSAEILAARTQASRFSQLCRVWAPMYRQRTFESLLSGGLGGNLRADNIAYNSVLSAWKDYLAHDNGGRPVIFIGHSQGSTVLIRLLRSQIDPSPSMRARMVSALLLGGNVQVPTGQTVGGSFQHIPVCASALTTGCVIAYSSFGSPPPSDSLFGRPGQGASLQAQQTKSKGQQVVCVNPVTFSSAPGTTLAYFLKSASKVPGVTVSTPWVAYPGLYSVTCAQQGNATWLSVRTTGVPGDPRPVVRATLGPTWGLHLYDVNLALGNLVLDVAYQEASYKAVPSSGG